MRRSAVRILLILFLLFALAGMGCVGFGLSLGDSFREVRYVTGEIRQSFLANDVVRWIARVSLDLWIPEEGADYADFSDVKKLDISVSGAVEIQAWDGETIVVESRGKSVRLDEMIGTLTVHDQQNSGLYQDSVTKIGIPSGYLLDKLELHETELVTGDELRADTVIIGENIADVTIESRVYARMELEVHANGGNVTIEKAAYTPAAVLNCNAGNIDVTFEGKRSDYEISALSRQGTITVDGVQMDNSCNRGQIQAYSNTGNIDIEFTQ